MLDDIPKGWRESFGIKMCEEIKELLIKENKFEEYQVMQIKEKFGELRWYGNYTSPELSKILAKYTELSRMTCMICGNTAKYVYTPWIYPICDKCSEELEISELQSIEEYWEDWDE
jgi:rubrerythrin